MARKKAEFACHFSLKWQIQDAAGLPREMRSPFNWGSSMHNIAESEREKGNPERLSAYLCGEVNPEPVNAYHALKYISK
jgi:hypothetical protein